MNRSVFVRLLALVLVLLLIPAALADSFKASVYASSMPVYSTNSAKTKYYLGSLGQGTEFTVLAMQGGWAKVSYQGRTGFAQVKYLRSSVHNLGYYTTKTTYVYKSASTSSTKLDRLTADYKVWVVGESGNYYLVDDYHGKFTGYIQKSCLSTKQTNPLAVASKYKTSYYSGGGSTTMPSSVKSTQSYVSQSMGASKWREYIVYAAQSKLGCAYKSSGSNGSTTFNSYNFVANVFKTLGFSVPGSIKSIGNVSESQRIDKNHLLKGDIVCFDSNKSSGDTVDIIGIYVGNGYFIHASNNAGCVVVSSMNTTYYKNAFRWGRRVIG